MNILIVDDNKIIVEILANLVRKCVTPTRILKSHTVNKAKKLLHDHKVDIVFLDLNIENQLDGIQLFKDIKTSIPDISVVIITSENNTKVVSTVLDIGPTDYIVKPLSLAKIERSILATSNI